MIAKKIDQKNSMRIMGFIIIFIILLIVCHYNYLLFHLLAEMFSIIIGTSLFLVMWNAKKYVNNKSISLISIAYAFIGIIDLMHTITYDQMKVVSGFSFYGNHFWVASRYFEGISLLIAIGVGNKLKRLNFYKAFTIYAVATIAAIFLILALKWFPADIWIMSNTAFKIIGEYLIILILLVCLLLLYKFKDNYSNNIYNILKWVIIITVIQELCFSLDVGNFSYTNFLGHYFKIMSFYLIYKAVVKTSIADPYDLIFREMKVKEKMLEESKAAAEKANSSKSVFLSNMSHEIRTPLNAILGYTQLMQLEKNFPEELKEYLDAIDGSGRHLLSVINNILEISKIEAGKVQINEESFNLPNMLKEIDAMFRIKIDETRILFNISKQKNIPDFLHSDQVRIRQIIINLIGNAVKFTSKGSITLTITEQSRQRDTVRLRFEVKDTGIGIPKEKLNSIFDPFEQVEGKNEQKEGTGLGLAISRMYVKLLGGDISATSTEDEGSSFVFEIDLKIDTSTKEENYNGKEILSIANTEKARTIMVVDDIKSNRDIVSRMLKSVGFLTVEAVDGEAAVRIFNEYHPDLVLMDIKMNGMDGLEALKRIRAQDRNLKTPIVMVSAYSLKEFENEAINSGADAYITKPFRREEVLNLLGKLLGIKYNYRITESISGKLDEQNIDYSGRVKILADKVKSDIKEALELGDIDKLMELIKIIEQRDSVLAQRLKELADEFNYDMLKAIIG